MNTGPARRESKSRPGHGVVAVRTGGFNQDGVEIFGFVRNVLVPGEGHAVEDRIENY